MSVSVCSCLFVPVRACSCLFVPVMILFVFNSGLSVTVVGLLKSFDTASHWGHCSVTAARHPQSAATQMDACLESSKSAEININVYLGGPKLA